jgi:hypothetical protein
LKPPSPSTRYARAASCRLCGNFSNAWNVAAMNFRSIFHRIVLQDGFLCCSLITRLQCGLHTWVVETQ